MTNVISLDAARLERSPHTAGRAKCLACGNEETVVAPVGTTEMECAACGMMRSVWMHPFVPEDGTELWMCSCGSQVFALTRRQIFCCGCGSEHEWRPEE